jgi:hypothetical protein
MQNNFFGYFIVLIIKSLAEMKCDDRWNVCIVKYERLW